MSKLIAVVGINIGDARFEPGEEVQRDLFTVNQIKHLVDSGSALVAESKGETTEVHKTIDSGEASPHPVIATMTSEEG